MVYFAQYMKQKIIIAFLAAALIFAALWFLLFQGKDSKIVDVSHIEVEFDITRYDRIFFEKLDPEDLIPTLHQLRDEDTTFFDFYTIQVMRFGRISDTVGPVSLSIYEFLTNEYVQGLRDTIEDRFSDLTPFKKELTDAFRHFIYYFPELPLPEVYTINTEFSYNVVMLDSSVLAVALDMYLGKEYPFYYSFDFPYYLIRRFEPEYMVPNAMEVIYNEYFGPDDFRETDALIYAMIENGKKLYFLECMQPRKPKHLLIGFTKEQLKWCKKEEGEIWRHYNELDLFYSKDYMEHRRHVNDGPSTIGMPPESPGNVGSWVGWQIVNNYMKNAGDNVTLQELLKTKPEVILAKSKYKPK
jgi:hypothetical protein